MDFTLEKARGEFFDQVFGRFQGYVCLATARRGKDGSVTGFKEYFFEWPSGRSAVLDFIEEQYKEHDVYFCVQLLSEPRRRKDAVKMSTCIWADLDECDPKKLLVRPPIVLETSLKRYQAFWPIQSGLEPEEAARLAKRIAYHHERDGADPTGWILTKLMRIPGTRNFKRSNEVSVVELLRFDGGTYRISDFRDYPEVDYIDTEFIPFSENLPDKTGKEVLMEYRRFIDTQTYSIFNTTPLGSWYPSLHRLEMGCFEAGMTIEETFIVARDSACNKFKRDNRPETDLWNDVCRAQSKFKVLSTPIITPKAEHEFLLSGDEIKRIEDLGPSFVERYIAWAKELTDAPEQYHEAGAFVVLSSILSGKVNLPTSFGTILPNMWFMILAETTLTRKTTSMNIAMDFLELINDDVLLATDGSIEGLFTALSMRSNRPSIFLKDEFSGLLDAIKRKDYYAGMGESLTKLYDGGALKRVLRKEVITVRNPLLIVYAGGIKNKIISLLEDESISSGFIPRFVLITGAADLAKIRPLGPPTDTDLSTKSVLAKELVELSEAYTAMDKITVSGSRVAERPHTFQAKMTEQALTRYNEFNTFMLRIAADSNKREVMIPMHERLCVSTLKAAMLIAASSRNGDPLMITEDDVLKAISYCEGWRRYAAEVINLYGRSYNEIEIDKVTDLINRHGGQMKRSEIMTARGYDRRVMDLIQDTMEQRNIIDVERAGKTSIIRLLGS